MILLLVHYSVCSQERRGFEEYYYPANPGLLSSLSSKLFYQGGTGWYTELRYNYEEERTVACSAGKTFSKENTLSYSFTPAVGLIAGKLQGATISLNTSLVYNKISFSSFLQNASSLEKGGTNYLFSWSELNYQVTRHFYAGAAMQQTSYYHTGNNWEPGMQLTISFDNWTFPLYLFKPAGDPCYFVAGVCHEWKN